MGVAVEVGSQDGRVDDISQTQRLRVDFTAADNENLVSARVFYDPCRLSDTGIEIGNNGRIRQSKCSLPADNDIRSPRQCFADGLISLTTHDDRLSQRQRFEMLEIRRHPPRHFPASADNPVPRHTDNDGDVKARTFELLSGHGCLLLLGNRQHSADYGLYESKKPRILKTRSVQYRSSLPMRTLNLLSAVAMISACLAGCSQTNLGEGNSMVTGSAGPQGARKEASQLPKCDRPLGTVALVEKQIPALAQMGLTSPVPVIRLMIAQSNCFQVMDRGQALTRIEQERAVSGAGGVGKLAAADFFITPDIVTQNANSGGFAGGAGALLPGVAGIIAGGITQKSSEAQTALYLTETRSGVQVAAATGSAKTQDFGWALGGVNGVGGVGGIGAGYSNTEIGKTTAAAFLDAYANLVRQVQNTPSLHRGAAPVQTSAIKKR